MEDEKAAWKKAAVSRSEMQKLAQQNAGAILNALEKFVLNRERTYEAFKRLDPSSRGTSDALALLEKARKELAEFKGRFGNEDQNGEIPRMPDQEPG